MCHLLHDATCLMPQPPRMPHWAKHLCVVSAAVASVYEDSSHRIVPSSPRRLARCQATLLFSPFSLLFSHTGDICTPVCGRKMWKTQCEYRQIMSEFRFKPLSQSQDLLLLESAWHPLSQPAPCCTSTRKPACTVFQSANTTWKQAKNS